MTMYQSSHFNLLVVVFCQLVPYRLLDLNPRPLCKCLNYWAAIRAYIMLFFIIDITPDKCVINCNSK